MLFIVPRLTVQFYLNSYCLRNFSSDHVKLEDVILFQNTLSMTVTKPFNVFWLLLLNGEEHKLVWGLSWNITEWVKS